jgi:hypothetical protein
MIWRAVGGVALVLAGYWHYTSLRADLRSARSDVVACRAVGASLRAAIETLERREEENTRQYEAVLTAMAGAVTRTVEQETRDDEQFQADLAQVAPLDGDTCAGVLMPEHIRVQLDPRARHSLPDSG